MISKPQLWARLAWSVACLDQQQLSSLMQLVEKDHHLSQKQWTENFFEKHNNKWMNSGIKFWWVLLHFGLQCQYATPLIYKKKLKHKQKKVWYLHDPICNQFDSWFYGQVKRGPPIILKPSQDFSFRSLRGMA